MERIITPNGDGINDVAGFFRICGWRYRAHGFDIRGRRVRTLGARAIRRTAQDQNATQCWMAGTTAAASSRAVFIFINTNRKGRVSPA